MTLDVSEDDYRRLERFHTLEMDEQLELFDRAIHLPDPQVRRRVLGLGAAMLSDSRLLEYLRSDDDIRRNAAVQMLKLRRLRAFRLSCALLEDSDNDVVLQAVLVLSHLGELGAVDPLVVLLDHEDPNIVQETILALGRLGDRRVLPKILPFLHRDTWLQSAAVEAIGHLGGDEVLPELGALLEDPILGEMSLEAISSIGGLEAARALAEHWVKAEASLAPLEILGRLADLFDELSCDPPQVEGLEEALAAVVREGEKDVKIAAARCLAAMKGRNRMLFMF